MRIFTNEGGNEPSVIIKAVLLFDYHSDSFSKRRNTTVRHNSNFHLLGLQLSHALWVRLRVNANIINNLWSTWFIWFARIYDMHSFILCIFICWLCFIWIAVPSSLLSILITVDLVSSINNNQLIVYCVE
jgi:hypothetical protein